MFTWSSQLDTGITIIDEQHRALVGMLAGLFDAMQSGAGSQVIDQVISGLKDYARDHFAIEERLMVAHDYPDIHGHRAAHEVFQNKIVTLKEQTQNGQGVLSIQVVLFLRNWLTEHICSTDQILGDFLTEKNVGLAAGNQR